MSLIIGRYNTHGYAIYDIDASIELYSAGNHALDSQIWIDPDDEYALSVEEISELCEWTGIEIVAENAGLVWDGLDFDDSGEIP